MSRYTLISSRDPFTCGTTTDLYELAVAYRRSGHSVTLFLVENGVLAARRGAHCPSLERVISEGVVVLADDFALRERAIPTYALHDGILPAALDRVVDGLVEGVKTVWH